MILVAGEALVDLVPSEDGRVLRAHPGGGPFNTARTLGRLARPVAFLGRLSTDRFGAEHERLLGADGVRLDAVVRTDDPSMLAVAEFDPAGNAAYRFYGARTAATGLTEREALAAVPAGVDVLHVGSLGLLLEPVGSALEALVAAVPPRTLVVLDPNIRPAAADDAPGYRARLERVLARADVVKLSDQDAAWIERQADAAGAARALLTRGPRAVVLTRGGEGAVVITAGRETAVPAPPVQVADTIGAGDAFGGGFVAWWHAGGRGRQELDDHDAVARGARFAAVVAARTVARAGADPPSLDELGSDGRELSRPGGSRS